MNMLKLHGEAPMFGQGKVAMCNPGQARMFNQPMGMCSQGPMGYPGQGNVSPMGGFKPRMPAFRGRVPIDKSKSMFKACKGYVHWAGNARKFPGPAASRRGEVKGRKDVLGQTFGKDKVWKRILRKNLFL